MPAMPKREISTPHIKSAWAAFGTAELAKQIHIPRHRLGGSWFTILQAVIRIMEATPSRLLKNSSSKGTFEGSPKGEM